MSDIHRLQVIGAGDENIQKANGKRLLSHEKISAKKLKIKEENMTDSNTQKRPNFSALAPNGVKTSATMLNSKPGCAKKLVIKNFKGR